MPALKNSKSSRRSSSGFASTVLCFLASAVVISGSIWYVYRTGGTLRFGDAEAHLDIARRIFDSRTPGWSQVGTTWLPLPHLFMIPLVRNDWLWSTGLAGAITSGLSMAIAAAFLFAAVRRIFTRTSAAAPADGVFLLNPTLLSLGSVPMTEPMFFASLFGLLYFTIRFRETQSRGALTGAALLAFAGTLTRYEAWFLLPFAAVYIWICARGKRMTSTLAFCLIAGAGPVLWLAHNRWYFGDPLYFYRGPYSAIALQGKVSYPGQGAWRVTAQYYLASAQAVVGVPALVLGSFGILAALIRRIVWPLVFLILPPAFYLWSIHSASTPVYVPALWPHTWYNTRYALAVLPLVAVGAAALAQLVRPLPEFTKPLAIVAIALAPFLIHPANQPITWQEADVNSQARREWTAQAVEYLRAALPRDLSDSGRHHETFFTSFGDLTGIFRTLAIPLRNTLTGDNDVEWAAAEARPDLFLHEDWAIVMGGDAVQTAIDKARLRGPRYELKRRIIVKGAPVIEIYRLTL
jgi:hypothetical protein